MKKLKLIPVLAVVFMLNTASMCSSDDDSPSSSSATPTQVTTNMTAGTWHVSSYQEDGASHTSDFNGYVFTFGAKDIVTASNGSNTQLGDWYAFPDSGSTKMYLVFNVADGPFESISEEDWSIVSSSASSIQLKHVSGGDGSIDLLTFEKI